MATTIINTQKVESFTKWQHGFDAGKAMREQAGIKVKGVFQSVDDENSVTVIAEVENADMAKAMFSSAEMKAAMEKAGVTSAPEIKILNPVM